MRYQNITQEFVLHDKLRISKTEHGPGARSNWVIVVNANSAIFQLYHGENKLIFNEMMMSSALY